MFLSPSPLLSEGGKQRVCVLRRGGDGGESSLPVWYVAKPVGWLIYFYFFFAVCHGSEQLRREGVFKINI